jgi:hypothetical protein
MIEKVLWSDVGHIQCPPNRALWMTIVTPRRTGFVETAIERPNDRQGGGRSDTFKTFKTRLRGFEGFEG